jgi:UDP-N-acetylmuramyl pentapeptide phosphotransferase/UDP-N-acetylglucosamine-1-phosphate transferase
MIVLLSAFAVSAALTLWLVRMAKARDGHWADHDLSGPQKFHTVPVPRIGGIGIAAAIVVGAALIDFAGRGSNDPPALLLMLCALPAFAAGLIEDFTKTVAPLYRLLATAISAGMAFWLLDAQISRTDIPFLDPVVAWQAGALIVTVFAVAGIANSVNIIDGFNGLASMCVAIMLAALAYVAFEVGDIVIMRLCLAGIGAVLGFFLWNFPGGLIFLGDGGAYLLGFMVAELSVLLLARNPQVSPIFPLLVCIYPVFETLFSIYRRRFLRSVPPSMPDGIHLHSLIYRRVIRWAVGTTSARALTMRNSMTSPFLWLLCMLSAVPAVFFWDNTVLLMISLLVFGFSYVVLYWRIVRFKAPLWMRALGSIRLGARRGDNPST